MRLQLFSRSEWGAGALGGYPTNGAKLLVVIHHSYRPHLDCGETKGSEALSMRSMDRYHAEQGWGGIGYNFLGFQSGNLYEGRGWGRTGAHTVGQNSASIGICLVIDGGKVAPSAALIEAIEQLISTGVRLGHISPRYRRAPHDEFQQKECPGKLVKSSILLRPVHPIATTQDVILSQPTLRKGKGGSAASGAEREAVKVVQRAMIISRLMKAGLNTGYFGSITDNAVREFQRRAGLKDDGIVGPKTWAAVMEVLA